MIRQTDEEIAHKVQDGDAEAFGVLVDRYTAKIERYANKFLFGYDDRQDMVQSVFVKAYTNIRSFDIRRPFSPWLYRIAHNEFISAIKKNGREAIPFFDPDTLLPHPVSPQDATSDAELRELREMLEVSLEKLTPKYREVLVLFYYEEMDYESISDVLYVPVSTVGVRLRRAREALKKEYQARNPTL